MNVSLAPALVKDGNSNFLTVPPPMPVVVVAVAVAGAVVVAAAASPLVLFGVLDCILRSVWFVSCFLVRCVTWVGGVKFGLFLGQEDDDLVVRHYIYICLYVPLILIVVVLAFNG